MSILKAFCTHLFEFIDDIIRIFPNDLDLKTSRKVLWNLKKVNPKALIVNWKYYVTDPYKTQIYMSNIDFFMNKDYKNDLRDNLEAEYILNVIERLRPLIRKLGESDQNKTTKYIINLTKLSELYSS